MEAPQTNHEKVLWLKNKVSSALYGALIYDHESLVINEKQKSEIIHGAWRLWEELAELLDDVQIDLEKYDYLKKQVKPIKTGYGHN